MCSINTILSKSLDSTVQILCILVDTWVYVLYQSLRVEYLKMLNYDCGFDYIFALQILILFLLGEYTFKICLPDELTLLSL